jgi:hypothetical protein
VAPECGLLFDEMLYTRLTETVCYGRSCVAASNNKNGIRVYIAVFQEKTIILEQALNFSCFDVYINSAEGGIGSGAGH